MATLLIPSHNHPLNDTQYPWIQNSLRPGQSPIVPFATLSNSQKLHTPPEGVKTLSVTTLPERAETPCSHSLPERLETPCLNLPLELQKKPWISSPPEGDKTLCPTPPEGEKTPSVQSPSVFIPVQNHNQTQSSPVGGRLSQFVSHWEQKKAHPSIIRIIQEGYRLPFRERPILTRQPGIHSGYVDSTKQDALLNSIQDLLSKKAIEVVHTQNSLGFYSRLFLVPKPNSRWRPVIDLSALNKFLAVPRFKMETPESIRASLRQNEWITSIDLTDTYLHVPIHPLSRKFLRFYHQGITYQFVSLPFGLATAPLVFTNLVKEVKSGYIST